MTPQERELLTRFLVDLNNTPAGLKDAEAAAMIDDAIRARPDAAYVLVQHAIMADEALHRAQAELAQLRAQQQAQPASGGSFLGGATASSTVPPTGAPGANPWVQPPQPQYQQPQYQQPQYQQAPYPQPQSGGIFGGGGGLGSFLRSAGTTAAGVVAGDMLFSSLGGLFGGHHGGGFGGGLGGGYGGGNVENVVINNYNDSGDDDGGSDGDWDDGN